MDREREVTSGPPLVRALGPWAAASLVVGTIIGTGIFLKTSVMAQVGGSAGWVLAAWVCAGGLSLFGALTYAELGAMFPRAGGEYVFLREGYGSAVAYLYAWNRFWIGTPGSIAAYAVGTATFLHVLVPSVPNTQLAIALIVLFSGVNCLEVRTGGWLQTALTAMKVAMIGGLAFGALALAHGGDWSRVTETGNGFPGMSAFGAMVLSALWAYDGWNNLPMAAGEVREPQKNLPRALVWGSLGVLVIYMLVNVGYFHALPFAEVVAPNGTSIAQRTATQFLGGPAQALLATAMGISAISAMNGSMLTGARVPYAVAADGLAPKILAHVAPRARVPQVAVVIQGAIACGYAMLGTFDQLTDAVVFASWLFYALNAGTVLLLRRRVPDRARSFRVPGYPIVPVIFMALALLLLVNAVWTAPTPSALGLAVTAMGALVYAVFLRERVRGTS
ncbi:MAG TPA: amino acid permease [Kofleriaceae bacterium]|nr:amino acid permease [Kofleriaceae bacterium]